MATPKSNRQKDVFAVDASRLTHSFPAVAAPAEPDLIPPSSGLRVPSSSSKPRAQPGMGPGLLRMANRALPSVQQTPTRRTSKLTRSVSQTTCRAAEAIAFPQLSSELIEKEEEEESKVPDRDSSPELPSYSSMSCGRTSIASITAIDQSHESTIQESPAKPAGILKAFTQPTHLPPEAHQDSRSIYQSLGWDNDIDELM